MSWGPNIPVPVVAPGLTRGGLWFSCISSFLQAARSKEEARAESRNTENEKPGGA